MEVRLLLNEDGDINDDLFHELLVLGPANLLKLTSNEIHLGLLHTDIKFNAVVPFNSCFKALLRAHPIRPFKLLPSKWVSSITTSLFQALFFRQYHGHPSLKHQPKRYS